MKRARLRFPVAAGLALAALAALALSNGWLGRTDADKILAMSFGAKYGASGGGVYP